MGSSSSSNIHTLALARDAAADSASARSPLEESGDNFYLPGEVIADRYRLIREIGRGGMGVVWEARSLALGVDVALKLIGKRGAESEAASRMAREAHAAARLAHPSLVRVFDFGWSNRGNPFLVMELVNGETLANVIAKESRIEPIRAVQMLLPVADGLRCAHEKGIVHRDIKPANVLIATDAFGRLQPKLLDFGIARLKQLPIEHRLTQAGVVMGSPAYMSPEQARGDEDVDERSDIWSLCVVLYEMISGEEPFRHTNYNALMQAILHQEPRSTVALGAGDAQLWQIIARGLAKDHGARWASMTDLGAALATWLYEHGIKEDLCGNSVRALWLDPSQPRRSSDSPVKRVSVPVQADIQTQLRPRRRPRTRSLFFAALLLVPLTAGAALWSRSSRSEALPLPQVDAKSNLKVAQAPLVVPESTRNEPVVTPQPSASAAASAPSAPPPRESTRTVRPSSAPRRERNKTVRDFGF
ncbi:MAG TPA: serine/threonine-protein kinase [Polyangiaceae bacterium]|nr:serine/threonine-protein kinase [Polyangiaceae bacterium]